MASTEDLLSLIFTISLGCLHWHYTRQNEENKKGPEAFVLLVGVVGFELTTLCSQSRCATRLRYTPYVRSL